MSTPLLAEIPAWLEVPDWLVGLLALGFVPALVLLAYRVKVIEHGDTKLIFDKNHAAQKDATPTQKPASKSRPKSPGKTRRKGGPGRR